MNKPVTVGIIDSGAGGLTILKEIVLRRLSCNIVYIADTEKYPYGTLPENEVCERVEQLVETTLNHNNIDICIIACNTASTIVLPTLRKRWSMPFIGVVPAVKPASKSSTTGIIGVLATPGTVSRGYLNQLICDFAANKTVYKYGSNILVEQAENYIRFGNVDKSLVASELRKLTSLDSNLDTIVLACTHFPLLKELFEELVELDSKVSFLDSTQAIVNRLEKLSPSILIPRAVDNNSCLISITSTEAKPNYASFIQKVTNTSNMHFVEEVRPI